MPTTAHREQALLLRKNCIALLFLLTAICSHRCFMLLSLYDLQPCSTVADEIRCPIHTLISSVPQDVFARPISKNTLEDNSHSHRQAVFCIRDFSSTDIPTCRPPSNADETRPSTFTKNLSGRGGVVANRVVGVPPSSIGGETTRR